jgi:hypothetical protein
MIKISKVAFGLPIVVLIAISIAAVSAMMSATMSNTVFAGEMSADDAWKALPSYQYGQDMAALLTMDGEVIRAMKSPADRSACAAKLAAILESPNATLPAKQYICLQLRQVGTLAEVPVLTKMLAQPETSEMARCSLESIPGDASFAALRNALGVLKGDLLIGVINSVAVRKDAQSVAKLKELAVDKDPKIANAAFWALGNIANPEAIAFVIERAKQAETPTPLAVAVPLQRCADALVAAGKLEQAQAVYTKLAEKGQLLGTRRAALNTLLLLNKEQAPKTILAWIAGDDADRRIIALGHLSMVSTAELEQMVAKLTNLPAESQLGVMEAFVSRKGQDALTVALSVAASENPEMKQAGLRMLGQISNPSAIGVLTDALAQGGKVAEVAQQSLCRLPRDIVGEAMLTAFKERPEIRLPVINVLKELKYYEAIDPLLALATEQKPESFKNALDALQGICDPDDADISRLVKLLLTVQDANREDVERTIVHVCDRMKGPADKHAKPVLAALANVDSSELPKYLPLLGRFGGNEIMQTINTSLDSKDQAVQKAAMRALCNWPNTEVADRLWTIATSDKNQEYRSWAFRAYVRVITLKSDRPEAETLAMLQKAMKQAENPEDQQWVLSRASTVRTLESVEWIATYLGDPKVNQTACRAIVDLAHHRFLRHPNMAKFGPLLEKVGQISKDPSVVERAKKYRLGL